MISGLLASLSIYCRDRHANCALDETCKSKAMDRMRCILDKIALSVCRPRSDRAVSRTFWPHLTRKTPALSPRTSTHSPTWSSRRNPPPRLCPASRRRTPLATRSRRPRRRPTRWTRTATTWYRPTTTTNVTSRSTSAPSSHPPPPLSRLTSPHSRSTAQGPEGPVSSSCHVPCTIHTRCRTSPLPPPSCASQRRSAPDRGGRRFHCNALNPPGTHTQYSMNRYLILSQNNFIGLRIVL